MKVDISSYLSRQGILPVRETSRLSYYRSPLPGRNDSNPSFVVNKIANRWIDYGLSKEPDRIIKLVCLLENCTLNQAIDKLLGKKSFFKKYNIFCEFKKEVKPSIIIVSIGNHFRSYLVSYMQIRGLKLSIVKKYCKQINVVFPNSEKSGIYSFIGFKNNLGGYELRNKRMKISVSPKYYTVIGNYGDRYVFEGFIDFLSYLVYNNIREIDGIAIILNSLTLLPWVYDIMRRPGKNHLYFDNDKTAEKCITDLVSKKILFVDHRKEYMFYNDYNKMLCNDLNL